jgi:arabinogalactan oligomer / maltooligosaccharide transport system substrate-binding protein
VFRTQWLRFPAMVLALTLLLAGSASGLAQDSEEDLSGSLMLWHGWTGAEADTLNNDILPAWQEANPNVSIETLAVPFDQLKNKYQTEAITGGGPDLLIGPLDWVGELAAAEVIQPLDGLVAETVLENYVPSTLEALTVDGQLYGLPESFEAIALFYNMSLVPEPPTTTAEMDEMAAQIAADNPNSYGVALRSGFYHSAPFLFGFGAELFDENNMSALDSPETVAFLQWIQEANGKPGYFMQNDDAGSVSLFQTGQAGMIIQGPWYLGDFQNALGAENVGVAPIPAISEADGAPAQPFLGVKHIMINWNADEEQARLAAAFAEWFTGPESVGFLVEMAGHLPANTQVELGDNPIAAAFVEQAETAVPLPTIPQMGQVWQPADDMITKVLSGDATPEEAAAEAAATINSGIEQMDL